MSGRQRRRLIDDCFLHDRDRMRHHDVLALLGERLTPVVEAVDLPLDRATGRYLAADIAAPRNVPLHDNAAVDGYAFAYADYARRNTLGIKHRVAAGDLALHRVGRGEAARIFTGATMPEGTDTVAMQEDCEESASGETVTIPSGLKPGANRRRAGEDIGEGATAMAKGGTLRPQEIAALASFGMARVPVFDRLRIGVFSTGNELVEPAQDHSLVTGEVFDSNRAMLKSLLATLPVEIVDYGIIADDAGAIEATVRSAAEENDVIVSSGGASRGEEDHMVETLDRLGKRHLWQIAVKPGRPMTFGQIAGDGHDCVFLGLPGNPVAVFVCFLLYVRTALIRLGGGGVVEPPRFPLPADFEIARKKTERREFLRGHLTANGNGLAVSKYPRDGSGLISGLRAADGLIELPEDVTHVTRGQPVAFIPFSAFGLPG